MTEQPVNADTVQLILMLSPSFPDASTGEIAEAVNGAFEARTNGSNRSLFDDAFDLMLDLVGE